MIDARTALGRDPAIVAGVARGRALFNRADYWGSHEALEAAWLRAPAPQRDYLQGLIQAGAAFHKYVVQDNPRGAGRLLTRALDKLDPAPDGLLGLALVPFRAELRRWRARLAEGSLASGPVVGLPRLEWTREAAAGHIRLDAVVLHRLALRAGPSVLVAVELDGVTGWGASRLRWGDHGAWQSLTRTLVPAVLAEPIAVPSELSVVWSDLGAHPRACAALEAALWDLWARRAGCSLYEALGIEPRPVPLAARVTGGEPAALAASLDRLEGDGYRQLILPARPNRDRRVLPALVGATALPVAVDLGGAYRLADHRALAAVAELEPVFMHQPLPSWNVAHAITLRRWLEAPQSLGGWRNELQLDGAIELGALDVVALDPTRCGLTEALRIAERAADASLPLWVDCPAVTSVGAAAALVAAAHPAVTLPSVVAIGDGRDGRPLAPPGEGGTTVPPSGPGLGVVPDRDWLADATVERQRFSAG